jgi:hypothetical protein
MASHRESSTTHAPHENPEKAPEDWVTGDEPMTGPQRSYLTTLCQEAGEEFDDSLTKAEASEKIDELQRKTGTRRCARSLESQCVFIGSRYRRWHSKG